MHPGTVATDMGNAPFVFHVHYNVWAYSEWPATFATKHDEIIKHMKHLSVEESANGILKEIDSRTRVDGGGEFLDYTMYQTRLCDKE